jgi:hypothetical protein
LYFVLAGVFFFFFFHLSFFPAWTLYISRFASGARCAVGGHWLIVINVSCKQDADIYQQLTWHDMTGI